MISRRAFATGLGLALVTRARPGNAQPAGRVHRMGWLSSSPVSTDRTIVERLRELGWIEGRNLVIENRFVGPDRGKLAAAAGELIALRVELLSSMNADLDAKRLELLREVLPKLRRVGVMWSPVDPSGASVMNVTEGAARSLSVQLDPLPIQQAEDRAGAFADAKQRAVDAVMILGTPILCSPISAASPSLRLRQACQPFPAGGSCRKREPDRHGRDRR